jgi:hypothetical protein
VEMLNLRLRKTQRKPLKLYRKHVEETNEA